jgi:outer membrane protein assembly factor BamB
VVKDHYGDYTGDYSLSLLLIPGATTSPQDTDGGDIVSGETKNGTIDLGADTDACNFYGEVGQAVVIQMSEESGSLHPEIFLYAPNGTKETSDWDSTSALISEHLLQQSGLYTIVVKDHYGDYTGEYSLSLTKIPSTPSPGIYNPFPANGATITNLNQSFSWDAVAGATGYDLYFGEDVIVPLEKIGENLSSPEMPFPAMKRDTVYYWHVEAHIPTGTIQGPHWWFKAEVVELVNKASAEVSNGYWYSTDEDSVSNVPLEWTHQWLFQIGNLDDNTNEPIINPNITAISDLDFVEFHPPLSYSEPPIYRWSFDLDMPENIALPTNALEPDNTDTFRPRFSASRFVHPEELVDDVTVQTVKVTFRLEEPLPADVNHVHVFIGFLGLAYPEDIPVNYTLISQDPIEDWEMTGEGSWITTPSSIEINKTYGFNATFEAVKSRIFPVLSKPSAMILYGKFEDFTAIGNGTSVTVNYSDDLSATFEADNELEWSAFTSNSRQDFWFDPVVAQLAETSWPMFHHDMHHTGRSRYIGAQVNTKWAFNIGSPIGSSPTIGHDETIYVGADDGKLYAINPDGTPKWNFSTGDAITSSPAVAEDGMIYVGSRDKKVYAINPNGTLNWSYTTIAHIHTSPVIDSSGVIYIAAAYDTSWHGELYALHHNGTLKWKFRPPTGGSWIYSSPAIGKNGEIIFGDHTNPDGILWALDFDDGSEIWRRTLPSPYGENDIGSSPAIDPVSGMIYVGGSNSNRYLWAVHPNGTIAWHYDTGGLVPSSPAIGQDGTVYVGSYSDNIFAINSDSTLKWSFATGGTIYSSPAIDAEETIYVGCSDGKLYAINPDGSIKWTFSTGEAISSSPAIGSDGTIYVGCNDGKLYAIGVTPVTCIPTDTDGDGVPDVWDVDNSTPAGYWVNSQGIGRMWGDMNGDGRRQARLVCEGWRCLCSR